MSIEVAQGQLAAPVTQAPPAASAVKVEPNEPAVSPPLPPALPGDEVSVAQAPVNNNPVEAPNPAPAQPAAPAAEVAPAAEAAKKPTIAETVGAPNFDKLKAPKAGMAPPKNAVQGKVTALNADEKTFVDDASKKATDVAVGKLNNAYNNKLKGKTSAALAMLNDAPEENLRSYVSTYYPKRYDASMDTGTLKQFVKEDIYSLIEMNKIYSKNGAKALADRFYRGAQNVTNWQAKLEDVSAMMNGTYTAKPPAVEVPQGPTELDLAKEVIKKQDEAIGKATTLLDIKDGQIKALTAERDALKAQLEKPKVEAPVTPAVVAESGHKQYPLFFGLGSTKSQPLSIASQVLTWFGLYRLGDSLFSHGHKAPASDVDFGTGNSGQVGGPAPSTSPGSVVTPTPSTPTPTTPGIGSGSIDTGQ